MVHGRSFKSLWTSEMENHTTKDSLVLIGGSADPKPNQNELKNKNVNNFIWTWTKELLIATRCDQHLFSEGRNQPVSHLL